MGVHVRRFDRSPVLLLLLVVVAISSSLFLLAPLVLPKWSSLRSSWPSLAVIFVSLDSDTAALHVVRKRVVKNATDDEDEFREPRLRVRAEVGLFNGSGGCMLSGQLQYKGCGGDGHIYLANMSCPWAASKIVAVKLPTKAASPAQLTANNTKPLLAFVPYSAGEEERLKNRFDILFGDTDSAEQDELLTLLAFVYGTARIPQQMLVDDTNNNCHTGFVTLPTVARDDDPATSAISMGRIMNYAPGDVLENYLGRNKLSLKQRQTIAAQLVRMYSHLFERNFLHCDLWNFYHFPFSLESNQVALVDFDRHQVLDASDPNKAVTQMWQQIQLLSLVGNVCNDTKHKETRSLPVNNGCRLDQLSESTWGGGNGLRQMIIAALKACQFKLDWDPPYDARNWTVERTRENYKSLRSWAVVDA